MLRKYNASVKPELKCKKIFFGKSDSVKKACIYFNFRLVPIKIVLTNGMRYKNFHYILVTHQRNIEIFGQK